MSWDIPTGERCDVCGEAMVKVAGKTTCSNKDCKNYIPPKRTESKPKKSVTKLKEGESAPPPLMDEPVYFGYGDDYGSSGYEE